MEKKERQERKNSTNGWTESCFHRSSLGPTEEEDCNGRRQAGAAVGSRAPAGTNERSRNNSNVLDFFNDISNLKYYSEAVISTISE